MESGPNFQRRFRIEISAFEHCDEKLSVEFDHYTCYVYSIEMIAVEKLRAICQQSPGYPLRAHPTPRARDFYDIFSTVSEAGVDFESPAVETMVKAVFAKKAVDLRLIGEIQRDREFHRADWPSVQNAVDTRLRKFDYYFDFVLAEAAKLQALWMV